MADRVMTDRLRTEALGMGMDLRGLRPGIALEGCPYLLSPQAILPTSKTVIVCGIHITDTWTEMGGEPEPQDRSVGGWMDQNSLMDRVAFRLVRLLNLYGYQGIAIASSNIWRYRQFEDLPSLFTPDLSHIWAPSPRASRRSAGTALPSTPSSAPARARYLGRDRCRTDADPDVRRAEALRHVRGPASGTARLRRSARS